MKRVAPCLEQVSLEFKQVLHENGQPIRYVYFPLSGVVSRLAFVDKDTPVEVATIGHEGMVGVCAFLGANIARARFLVHVPGEALRMPLADLRNLVQPDSSMVQLLNRYLTTFLTQITQTVACNTFHPVEKRFCRWLLMMQDRTRSDRFPLTQDLIAQMLGVRRASVSDAARRLQSAGLIRYVHGK
ncbi:MAG TPA: Crp/Fnr family transcriptional regulator, partial [Gemmataceae bacterium]|nr:Crp/Fnr family transcriptional regulator [Gemmataceae bacterium]